MGPAKHRRVFALIERVIEFDAPRVILAVVGIACDRIGLAPIVAICRTIG